MQSTNTAYEANRYIITRLSPCAILSKKPSNVVFVEMLIEWSQFFGSTLPHDVKDLLNPPNRQKSQSCYSPNFRTKCLFLAVPHVMFQVGSRPYHMTEMKVATYDIKLDNVPKGLTDLMRLN